MDLLGNTYKHWYRERDRVSYQQLIHLLIDLNCSVFVGAGLSVHAGYPTFGQLVDYLADQANIPNEALANIDDLPQKAKEIRTIIEGNGVDFYNILYRRFDDKHFQIKKTTELLENFIQIPFRSIVTTNYDSCLEDVAFLQNVRFSEDAIQVFPFLDVSNLDARRIYHIHGKIDHNNVEDSSQTLILTVDDFEKAYSSDSPLPNFLYGFLETQNVVFIGFALEERTLIDILELSKKRKNFILGYPMNPPKNPPTKFAILPIEKNKVDSRIPEADRKGYLAYIEERDRRIETEYDVIILRYLASSNYFEMEAIIKNIYSKTKASTVKVTVDLTNTGVPT
jgi:NAD-dependent SIR2 family protein deacetylase